MAPGGPSPPPPRGNLSLYANLLNPSASASDSSTIARAPVLFAQPTAGAQDSKQDEASTKKQVNAAALRFQPTKRPQLQAQKAKPKAPLSAPTSTNGPPSSSDPIAKAAAPPNAPAVKSTLADWTVDDDDDVNGFYAGEKRQRGGRKKRKKNNKVEVVVQNWDDIYDPARPNNYEDYKHSEEKYREIREWKDRLYAHRLAQRRGSDVSSDGDDNQRPKMSSKCGRNTTVIPADDLEYQFAPPSNYSFAPPPMDDASPPRPPSSSPPSPPPPPPADIPDDATGDAAYARRMRLTQGIPEPAAPSPPPPPPATAAHPPPPPPPSSTISRAPVRYNLPEPPPEIPASEAQLATALAEDADLDASPTTADDTPVPRSSRPGQAGFAARLMSKYGWSAGSGLGAAGNEGIVAPLRVQVEKRKKKSDAEGGGWAGPAGKGRIVDAGRGGKKGEQQHQQHGRFGPMSEVVVLRGMLIGIDMEAEARDGALVQEIGDECGDKYGRVERVVVRHQQAAAARGAPVFVKFTSQLSALRAVNALEGRVFNGNTIEARFYDAERFESGALDDGDDV